MKKIKKNQFLLFSLIILLFGWGIYFHQFYKVYQMADFFTDSNAAVLVKLVYVFTYYGDLLVPYVVVGFILLNLNMLFLLVTCFISPKETNSHSVLTWIAGGMFLLATTAFMFTSIWPLMSILIVVSLVIAYTLYTVFRKSYEETKNYEEYELIKEAGPFTSEEEAEAFFEEFRDHWSPTFARKNLVLVPKIILVEQAYQLKIHVEYQ